MPSSKMPDEVFGMFTQMIGKSLSPTEEAAIRIGARRSSIRTLVGLQQNERGLVINVPTVVTDTGVFKYGKSLDPQLVRLALLFWDKIDFPQNNHKRIPLSPEERELAKASVLVRSLNKFHGRWTAKEVILDSVVSAFKWHEYNEPGLWSVAHRARSSDKPVVSAVLNYDGSLSISHEEDDDRAFLFELHKAILVPSVSVPIYDVLEFRDRRRPELLACRSHLESLYEDVISSPDRPLRERHTLEKLDKSLSDHLKVARETRFPFVLASLQAKFDAQTIGVAFATTATAASAGLSHAAAAMTGIISALTASLSLTAGRRGATKTSNPFAYVARFHREIR